MRDPLTALPQFCVPRFLPGRAKGAWFVKSIALLVVGVLSCVCGYSQEPMCKTVAAGQEFWIRLVEPVSTYSSKQGTAVQAVMTESPRCGEEEVFPARTVVQGRISYVRRVGMAVWHGSSALTIEFDKVSAGAESLPMKAQVQEVANAREGVKRGVIQGVGGRATPQEVMSTRLLHLPFWNTESYWIFLLRRGAFPFSPEPEIYLPAGTDLRLKLMAPLELPAEFLEARQKAETQNSEDVADVTEGLRARLLALPSRSTTRSGRSSDVVNLALIGSAQQIEEAFKAAGWTYGDSVSAWSVLREMKAFSSLNSYPHLPISKQWLGGQAPAIRLQKSLDSYQKREHIRIWNEDAAGQDLWAASAIRETSATWSLRTHRFIHHVDGDVSAERDKVVRDLTMTGCVSGVYRLRRPGMAIEEKNASGDALWGDGEIAVVELNDCQTPAALAIPSVAVLPWRPNTKLKRFVRAQALSIHDLWRSNAIYASFDLSRALIHSLRNRHTLEEPSRENAGSNPSGLASGAN
jgi:LssY-like putative type I secretion system component LssY